MGVVQVRSWITAPQIDDILRGCLALYYWSSSVNYRLDVTRDLTVEDAVFFLGRCSVDPSPYMCIRYILCSQ